jgi:HEAT repeat protein
MVPDDLAAQERLKDLNISAKQGFQEGDAPLIRALNDPDERVRARAQELMAGDWSAEIDADYRASQ